MKRPPKITLPLLVALLLFACTEIPDFGTEASTTKRDFPRILPVQGLIVRAIGPAQGSLRQTQPLGAVSSDIAARVARLKARAAILRGAPVDANTRARLSGG